MSWVRAPGEEGRGLKGELGGSRLGAASDRLLERWLGSGSMLRLPLAWGRGRPPMRSAFGLVRVPVSDDVLSLS